MPHERFGVEYFGKEFHGPAQSEHDEERLAWAREQQRWTLLVALRDNVVGRKQDIEQTLRSAWNHHRSLTRPQ